MTEVWRSNKMHWCDLCKVWMNDNKAARQNHERGMKHVDNLQRKMREMTRKADAEEKTAETAAKNFARIEERARLQHEADQKEREALAGSWAWDASCSYYYNEKHRWYFDPKTRWYYGGEPQPAWAQHPPLPGPALFGVAKHEGGPVAQGAGAAAAAAAPAGAGAAGAAAGAAPAGGAGPSEAPAAPAPAAAAAAGRGRTIALPNHPQAKVGGDWGQAQAAAVGRLGAAKGVGLQGPGAGAEAGAGGGGQGAEKRKREEGGGGGKGGGGPPLSKEEQEFQARREAARARVQQRTAQNFGYL